MATSDPIKLTRARNRISPETPCGEFLARLIDLSPTLDEAAAEIGVSRPTLIKYRRRYGMTVRATAK